MSMSGDCPICVRLREARAGREPFVIAELQEMVVALHEHQAYEGWCVLWLKDHADHLADLLVSRQVRVWEDVARVAEAVRTGFKPRRLNYACLGNVVSHVHWHVIPRHAEDPDPRGAVWARPAKEIDTGVEPARRDALIARLREAGLR